MWVNVPYIGCLCEWVSSVLLLFQEAPHQLFTYLMDPQNGAQWKEGSFGDCQRKQKKGPGRVSTKDIVRRFSFSDPRP